MPPSVAVPETAHVTPIAPSVGVALSSMFEPDVHEIVTVAREMPDVSAYLDASATADAQAQADAAQEPPTLIRKSSASLHAAAPSSLATPLVPMANEAPLAHGPPSANVSAAPAPVAPRSLKKTMLGPERAPDPLPLAAAPVAAGLGADRAPSADLPEVSPPSARTPGAASSATPRPGSAPGAGHGAPALRTMLGMPARDLMAVREGVQRAHVPSNQKTMMGVATPGVAPTGGGGTPNPLSSGSVAAAIPSRSLQGTMLGVARPGIAPTNGNESAHANEGADGDSLDADGTGQHGTQVMVWHGAPQGHAASPRVIGSQLQNTFLGVMVAPEIPIVPRPKTLIDEPFPAPPVIPPARGVSAVLVVGILIAVVVVLGGIGAFVALRAGGSITAAPQLDESGRESLKLGCATCPDGTIVSLGASRATVEAGSALLTLPAPLAIGNNDLTVNIDRPGAGRDEDVKVHVPVSYRVRADLSTLSSKPPAITVQVEATAGSDVVIEGQSVVLDPTGHVSYAVDLSKETEGPGEAKTFERKIPFSITPKGGKVETGELTARAAVVVLALDAPGSELYTAKKTAPVAGQTRPNATITINGQNVAVDPTGRFGVRVDLANAGDDKPDLLEIVASAPMQASRIAKVRVTHVTSLEETAKALESLAPITFEAFGPDPASKAGQNAVVEGDVVEARAGRGHTILLVDTKRGCESGATCLVRLSHGEEDQVARGDTVRAYGRVVGAVTASGKIVPDLEISLIAPVAASK